MFPVILGKMPKKECTNRVCSHWRNRSFVPRTIRLVQNLKIGSGLKRYVVTKCTILRHC